MMIATEFSYYLGDGSGGEVVAVSEGIEPIPGRRKDTKTQRHCMKVPKGWNYNDSAHDNAVAAAFAPVKLIALSCSVFGQINVGFEGLQLVHGESFFSYRPAHKLPVICLMKPVFFGNRP